MGPFNQAERHQGDRRHHPRDTRSTLEGPVDDIDSRSSHASQASPTPYGDEGPPSKIRKVSRACDFCKSRKSKCSGEQPCSKCVAKGRTCLYNAKYTRGRPPTPPPSGISAISSSSSAAVSTALVASDRISQLRDVDGMVWSSQQQKQQQQQQQLPLPSDNHDGRYGVPMSRASPELGMAEIQGQVFDPTSPMTFLHRAWKKLSARNAQAMPEIVKASADHQLVVNAGDRPLPERGEAMVICLPSPEESQTLINYYFDICIATYRLVHKPSVERWLAAVQQNSQASRPVWHGIGHSRAAIVLVALAVGKVQYELAKGSASEHEEARAQAESDKLFGYSAYLTDQETGYPKLESAQARLAQVMYLLTTARFNTSWYVFGDALQIISAIGLHRRDTVKRRRLPQTDYIQSQFRIRTFWTAYMLDHYLGVVFGRPRHFHDEDIDQEFPDRVSDENMTATGPGDSHGDADECHIDGLIHHAKIGQIMGSITREVYSIKEVSEGEREAAARRLIGRIKEWRDSLPAHLGAVRPSMLIPSYRRQATILKLAYSHAIMHASRLFILGNMRLSHHQSHVDDCVAAAKSVLETVEFMINEGPWSSGFWWTHYVTFAALVVIYVWEIQQRRANKGATADTESRTRVLALAETCQKHLARVTATHSPSRRYAVILEEFRAAATSQPSHPEEAQDRRPSQSDATSGERQQTGLFSKTVGQCNGSLDQDHHAIFDLYQLDQWQTTDWLDLDSSVCI